MVRRTGQLQQPARAHSPRSVPATRSHVVSPATIAQPGSQTSHSYGDTGFDAAASPKAPEARAADNGANASGLRWPPAPNKTDRCTTTFAKPSTPTSTANPSPHYSSPGRERLRRRHTNLHFPTHRLGAAKDEEPGETLESLAGFFLPSCWVSFRRGTAKRSSTRSQESTTGLATLCVSFFLAVSISRRRFRQPCATLASFMGLFARRVGYLTAIGLPPAPAAN